MKAVLAGTTLALLVLSACGSGSPRRQAGPPATETVVIGATPAPATATPTTTLPAALAQAGQALAEGRYEAAIEAYAAVAAATPGSTVHAQALLGIGIARYEGGNPAAAIDDLRAALAGAPAGSTVQRRALYLLARRLNEAGRYAEAAAALRPFAISSVSDALRPYLLAEAARAAGESGDPAGAASGWDELLSLQSPPKDLVTLAYRERARMASAAGDSAAARNWVAKLAAATADPAVRYELAELAREAGDNLTFAAQLRAIISESPGAKEAVLAIADLRSAGYAVDRGQAGLAYYRRGAYAEARAELLKAMGETGLAASDLAFRLYYLGAAYEDSGQPENAIGYYDRAAATDPASPYAHKAQYWAARSVEASGDLVSASRRFLALAVDGPTGDFTGEAAFRAGYTLLRAGDAAGAITTWDRTSNREDARLLYWKGRALQSLRQGLEAGAAFAHAAALEPWGFYGVEAARESAATGPTDVTYRRPAPATSPDWDSIVRWLEGFAVAPGSGGVASGEANEMAAMGLREAASAVLATEAGEAGPARLFVLMRQAHDLGFADVAAALAVRLRLAVGATEAGVPVSLLRLAYPIGYVTLLNQEGPSAGLDPLFVAAMVRQESFWNPLAGSRAGALGLTQVIPSTGEGIAGALGIDGFKSEDLFRPSVSLRFGSYYLGGQLKRFENPLAALAAYNAGPRNAIRWVDAAPGARAPDFVEAIDIGETRDYVERVMDHYAHYLYAYGGAP